MDGLLLLGSGRKIEGDALYGLKMYMSRSGVEMALR